MSGKRHRVGVDPHVASGKQQAELKAGRTGMNDDRIAVTHKTGGCLSDCPFRFYRNITILVIGARGYAIGASTFARRDATIDLAGSADFMKLVDITANGRSRNPEMLLKVAHGCKWALLQQISDDPVPVSVAQ
jgi:hypothetical protein